MLNWMKERYNVLKGPSRNIPNVFVEKSKNWLTRFVVNIYSCSRWGERHWLHSLELDGQLRMGAWLPVFLFFYERTCIFVRPTYYFDFDFLVFVFCQQWTIWNGLRKLPKSSANYYARLIQKNGFVSEEICDSATVYWFRRISKILFCVIPHSCVTDKYTNMKK